MLCRDTFLGKDSSTCLRRRRLFVPVRGRTLARPSWPPSKETGKSRKRSRRRNRRRRYQQWRTCIQKMPPRLTWTVSLKLGSTPVINSGRTGWRPCPQKPNFSRPGPARNHAQLSWRRWARVFALNGGKRLAESSPNGKTSLFAHFPVGLPRANKNARLNGIATLKNLYRKNATGVA